MSYEGTYWRTDLIKEKPWLKDDFDNPCREFRKTGKHCVKCPYNPVCNE